MARQKGQTVTNGKGIRPEKARVGDEINKPITAKVISVQDGQHGPYAVATAPGFEHKNSITFFLGDEELWLENRQPNAGEFVILWDVVKKTSGWRAMKGRLMRPSDKP